MSVIDSNKKNWIFPISKGSKFNNLNSISDYGIIDFTCNSLKPERRVIARRQIDILKRKMTYQSHLKPFYIQQINKLILFEKGELQSE